MTCSCVGVVSEQSTRWLVPPVRQGKTKKSKLKLDLNFIAFSTVMVLLLVSIVRVRGW